MTLAEDEVTVLPYWSSMVATMVPRLPPLTTLELGSVVKMTLLAAAGVTAIEPLTAVVSTRVESVAVSVQLRPVVMVTALKVATPLMAANDVVPVKVQPLEMTMVSVEPVPEVMTLPLASSTLTTKELRAVPAVVVLGGAVV